MTKQEQSDPLLAIKSFLLIPEFRETPNGKYWKWLIDNAKPCSTKPLSKAQLEEVKELLSYQRVGMLPAAKICFYYNQIACLATDGKLEYWEGQAVGSFIPVEHAWLMYKGKVVDAVWGTIEHIESPDGYSAGSKQDYAGMKIPFNMVLRSVASGIANSLIFDFFQQSTKTFQVPI